MTLTSFEAVYCTVIFLLPGFIIKGIIDSAIPPKRKSDGIYFLECLMYSIVCCACCSWVYINIINSYFDELYKKWLLILVVTFLGAGIIGFIVIVIKNTGVIRKFFRYIHISIIHPTPTAWDYYFSQQKESYVIITLQDGTQLLGLYSYDSFASSENEERDIYVEKGYKIGETGEWIEDEESEGFYIPRDEIKYIEFKRGVSEQ